MAVVSPPGWPTVQSHRVRYFSGVSGTSLSPYPCFVALAFLKHADQFCGHPSVWVCQVVAGHGRTMGSVGNPGGPGRWCILSGGPACGRHTGLSASCFS